VELASYLCVLIGILLIAVVVYLENFAPEALVSEVPQSPPVHNATGGSAPAEATEAPAHEAEHGPQETPPIMPEDASAEDERSGVTQGVVAQGDTAGSLFQQWLSPVEANKLVEACAKVFALTKLRVGQPYTAYIEDGSLVHFEYEIDRESVLVITSRGAGTGGQEGSAPATPAPREWTATVEPIQYDIQLAVVEGQINDSLFESVAKAGERPALALRLAEIFAWEINFIRDIQPGDSFRVLIEKRYRDGQEKAYGSILAAEFINQGSKYEAYRHPDSFGKPAYFNAMGDSLRRAFLKAPLAFNRISSRFNLSRLHPILREIRAHPATDYAAPKGTPVKAIGSGQVSFRGWGKGAGNYITLKHANGYESMYLHLSGFARNLRKGGRVRQGEVIGFVGSTGYATGPHLDFRMKKNGKYLNPEKVLSPRDESVPKKDMVRFKARRDTFRAFMNGEKNIGDYLPEKDAL
jgi:murein DD-endopeptidase MepM/ murein hydrolase activator NlpD